MCYANYMKCLYCHNKFTANRCTAKYCSTKCRVYFNRRSVTLPQIQSTPKRVQTVTLTSICKEHGIDKQYCRLMKHKHHC